MGLRSDSTATTALTGPPSNPWLASTDYSGHTDPAIRCARSPSRRTTPPEPPLRHITRASLAVTALAEQTRRAPRAARSLAKIGDRHPLPHP
ncbi:MAG: hypothetical protein JO281_18090 [Pseudonocardiales bacterium]|nr:hypothetical protein [Pseudonocardiales bacterium]